MHWSVFVFYSSNMHLLSLRARNNSLFCLFSKFDGLRLSYMEYIKIKAHNYSIYIFYFRVYITNIIAFQDLASILRMTHVFKRTSGILCAFINQNLFASRVLTCFMSLKKWLVIFFYLILKLCNVIHFTINDHPKIVSVVVLGNFFVRVKLNRHGFINERKKMKRINKVWRLHKKKKNFFVYLLIQLFSYDTKSFVN